MVLLGVWAIEGRLHSIDSSTVAITAVALMFVQGIGVIGWKHVQSHIPWGILIQLGVGDGLGTALLKIGAAGWLRSFSLSSPSSPCCGSDPDSSRGKSPTP